MTLDECQAFLSDKHVAVLSISEEGRGPRSVPVWYVYEPGGSPYVATGADSKKAALLAQAGRCTLCVQVEEIPYRWVSVEGPIVMSPLEEPAELQALAYRYLGQEMGDQWLASTAGNSTVIVRLSPETWRSGGS
jgi:nitroimidazol reductase NimA-like FMN-containing flavoprotein (pyridoxamine 5'-phosphate oxidase superfamily)